MERGREYENDIRANHISPIVVSPTVVLEQTTTFSQHDVAVIQVDSESPWTINYAANKLSFHHLSTVFM
ncbi:hypothetical protein ACLOJK_041876 [Asimina triloba]